MKKKNALFVLCDPGKKVLEKRMKEDPDEYVTHKENLEMLERYKRFFDSTTLRKIKVDTSKPTEKTLKLIEKKIDGQHLRHREIPDPGPRLPLVWR